MPAFKPPQRFRSLQIKVCKNQSASPTYLCNLVFPSVVIRVTESSFNTITLTVSVKINSHLVSSAGLLPFVHSAAKLQGL